MSKQDVQKPDFLSNGRYGECSNRIRALKSQESSVDLDALPTSRSKFTAHDSDQAQYGEASSDNAYHEQKPRPIPLNLKVYLPSKADSQPKPSGTPASKECP